MTEQQLTAECFQWAWERVPQTRYLLFHVPNEGRRHPATAGILKAMGMIPGVPDFVFIWKGRTYGIEMKLPGQPLSGAQKKVCETWIANGANTIVCYSLVQFQQIIIKIVYN